MHRKDFYILIPTTRRSCSIAFLVQLALLFVISWRTLKAVQTSIEFVPSTVMYLKRITYPIWCFILFHYSSAKFAINKLTSCEPLLCCLSIIPTIFLLLITCLVVIIFGSYKYFVYLCLKIWYGKKFIKFVPGCGIITSFNKKDFNHISFMAKLTTRLSGNELFDQLNDRVFEKFFVTDIRNQLLCLCRRQMGYFFMLSIRDIEIEEVFREIKTDKAHLTDTELQDYMNKFFGSPMPRNDEMTFDMALCTTPLEDDTNKEDIKTYAVLFRVKHCVGDGLVFYNLLNNAFTKSNQASETYVQNLTKPNERVEKLKKCPTHMVNMFEGPWYKRELVFSGDTLTNGLYVAKESNCLWKIKQIRKAFSGVSFVNVIMTAYTASMAEFFKKYHPDQVPATINIGCPMQVDQSRIRRLLSEGGKNDFDNNFSTFQVVCPIVLEDQGIKGTLTQRMLLIQKNFDEVFNSFDIPATYVMFSVFMSLLPLPLVAVLCYRLFFGTMISCVPGGPKMELFNGDEIKSPAFFIPLQHVMGITLSVLTYGDLIQMGFSLDGAKFDSQEKIDLFINGVFENLDLLYEESVKSNEHYSISRL